MRVGVLLQSGTQGATHGDLRVGFDDHPWCDGIASNAAVGVRGRDVAGERDESRFRGPVRRKRATSVERRSRRRVHDDPATSFDQVRDRETTAEHRASEVDRENTLPGGQLHCHDVLVEAVLIQRRGVVVQDVEAAVRRHRVGNHGLHLRRDTDIDDLRSCLTTVSRDVVRYSLCVLGVDIRDRDGRACAGELSCGCRADAATRAGHDRDLAAEPHARRSDI